MEPRPKGERTTIPGGDTEIRSVLETTLTDLPASYLVKEDMALIKANSH